MQTNIKQLIKLYSVHECDGYFVYAPTFEVFDWTVKKFSEYGAEDGYVAKFHAAIEDMNGNWEDDTTDEK